MPRDRTRFTLGLLIAGVALLLSACGAAKVVSPLPKGPVIGPVPQATPTVTGDASAGKAAFAANGCAGCHTLTAAAATGKVGPDLDSLAAEATTAGQPLEDFIKTSIIDPDSYIAPGFSKGIMPPSFGQSLSPQQLADLVAFLNQSK